jgi:hypothetical protein
MQGLDHKENHHQDGKGDQADSHEREPEPIANLRACIIYLGKE